MIALPSPSTFEAAFLAALGLTLLGWRVRVRLDRWTREQLAIDSERMLARVRELVIRIYRLTPPTSILRNGKHPFVTTPRPRQSWGRQFQGSLNVDRFRLIVL